MGCLEKCEEECHRRNGMLKRDGEASERGCLMVGLSKDDVFCWSKWSVGIRQIVTRLRRIWSPSLGDYAARFEILVFLRVAGNIMSFSSGCLLKLLVCCAQGPPSWFLPSYSDVESLNLRDMPRNASIIPDTKEIIYPTRSMATTTDTDYLDDTES